MLVYFNSTGRVLELEASEDTSLLEIAGIKCLLYTFSVFLSTEQLKAIVNTTQPHLHIIPKALGKFLSLSLSLSLFPLSPPNLIRPSNSVGIYVQVRENHIIFFASSSLLL